ncbi:autotransporter outer membrane beta-barrel domain-containing protein [Bradyrhizobium sp.]|uniref:autotransporter outer membrane beta-barrel domain-containing protein n=1 Tax=Bradyrhizobium sp. TaxID=376 RepID=UPI003C3FCB7D
MKSNSKPASTKRAHLATLSLGLERRSGLSWREALLGTAAAGALSFAIPGPALAAPDPCTLSGGATIAICSGNQSAGIASGVDFPVPPVNTLDVNNLTQAIAPASGIPGIAFTSNSGDATITSNTGAFGITTVGPTAFGILALGSGAVTVISTGNITTTGSYGVGIAVSTFPGGAITVTSTGNITTSGNHASGILAKASGAGPDAVAVTSTGNIATKGTYAYGIFALGTGAAPVTVNSAGTITTQGDHASGILASSGGGGVTVNSTANIATAGNQSSGIFAVSTTGAVTVTSTGNITTLGAGSTGIYASSIGGAVTVTSIGNIATKGNHTYGIEALSSGGPIAITVKSGTVSDGSGSGAGVLITGGTNNTLTNFGTVTALSGLAIEGINFFRGRPGNNTVNNFGTVTGNVALGSGANAFNNMATGLFNAATIVNLGAGNTLTNAGTLSPGGAGTIQTTTLSGNLTQTTTGRLLTDINIAGATADRVNVSGTANLAGAVQLQVQNLALGPWQQTILSAAGGATNNGLSLLGSPVLQAQLVYPNANDVVVKSAGINFMTPGLNGNQTSLGNAFNGVAQTAGLGGPIFNLLLNGPTSLDGYRQVLNQLTGEGATGTQQATFDAMGQFVGLLLDPYSRGGASPPGGGVSGYAAEAEPSAYASGGRQRSAAERDAYAMFTKAPPQSFAARWNVWVAGFGGSQTTDGNADTGSNSTTSRIAGTVVGADYLITPNTIAGFALAGGGTGFVIANGVGTGRSDLFQAGAYVRHTIGPAYIAAALGYGWQDVTTNRTVTLAGIDQLQAQFNANAWSGRIEGGYRLVSPWMGVGITPYAAGQFTTVDLPAYAEQSTLGTSNFALAYAARSVTAPRSEFGFRTDKSFVLVDTLPDTILTLRGRFAWAHDYNTDRSIAATFQTLPGASFVVNGAAQSADKALTTAAAEVRWRSGFSLSGTFEGEFSSNSTSYAGKAVARYQW